MLQVGKIYKHKNMSEICFKVHGIARSDHELTVSCEWFRSKDLMPFDKIDTLSIKLNKVRDFLEVSSCA